jgi:nitrous oxidase accessory protein
MYGKEIIVLGNSLSDNHGPSGGGIGLKDVDNLLVEGNRFVNNQIAAQVDTSPVSMNVENVWRENVFAFNEVGIGFTPSVRHNTLTGNSFIDNTQHVAIFGRGKLKDISWAENGRGNYWSDYAGYDADGDGIGDMPYKSQGLFESLTDRHPELRLFRFSPAAQAVDFAAEAFPAARPETKLEDPAPLIAPAVSSHLPEPVAMETGSRVVIGLAGFLFVAAGMAAVVAMRPRKVKRITGRLAPRFGAAS